MSRTEETDIQAAGRGESKLPQRRPILIVEDDPVDQELIVLAFERAGVESPIITMPDGQAALDYLNVQGQYKERRISRRCADYPCVIVLDLDLPRINGHEFLRKIKGQPGLASIPVVVLTTSQSDLDLTGSYALGASSCVTKPGDFERLVEIARAIGDYWTGMNRLPEGE